MDNQQAPKSVVVKTYQMDGVQLRLTEKGAIVVYTNNGGGDRYSHSFSPTHVKVQATFCPIFAEIVAGPEWASIQTNRERSKVESKLHQQVQKQQTKGIQLAVAAFDQLKATGLNPEQIQALLGAVGKSKAG